MTTGRIAISGRNQKDVFAGSQIGGFTNSNKIDNGNFQDFKPGKTLFVIFNITSFVGFAEVQNIIGSSSGDFFTGKGWRIAEDANNVLYFLSQGTGTFQQLTLSNFGIQTMCFRWLSGSNAMHYSLNGSPSASLGVINPPTNDSSCKAVIGSSAPGDGTAPLSFASVIAFAMLSREMTGPEIAQYTTPQENRYFIPNGVTKDSACEVDFNCFRDFSNIGSTFSTKGYAPTTYTLSGTLAPSGLQERAVSFSSGEYQDGKIADAVSGGIRRNSYSRVRFSGVLSKIGIKVISPLAASGGTEYTKPGHYTSGSNYGGTVYANNNRDQILDAPYAATVQRTVDIIEGPQIFISSVIGTYITGLRVSIGETITVSPTTAPASRLLLVGDSILTGFWTTRPHADAVTPKLRADYPGQVTMHGWGGLAFYDLASDASARAVSSAIIIQELDGTNTNTLWFQPSTNDYANNNWSPTAFKTALIAWIDLILAGKPDARIYLQSATQRIAPDTEAANGLGFTTGDYRTAISDAAVARPANCIYVNGAAGAIVPNAQIYSDGLHLTTTGAATYKAFIKTTLNY